MPTSQPTVILRACADYDVQRIRTLAREGLEELDLRPHGRTLLKPNVVASGPHFPHAHTRPEFVEGVVAALKDRAAQPGERGPMTELAVGERCGITLPTRFAFKGAGYYPMFKRADVKHYHFEEEPQVEIPLYHQGRLRDSFFTPEPVAAADFFVNCPKFKAHPWTTVTFSMKNYIGIQDDRHRLIDHDHLLNQKVADLQYIIQPQFIAIDGITAGEGRMLTPVPFNLGLVIMGNNQVAFDAVCCHIIGVDPLSVEHIRLAYERGFGPVELDRIKLSGDVSLDEAKAKASGFKVGLIRVEEYFEGTSIRAYGGKPPGHEQEYCWGGCPGALEEAIEILRLFDSAADSKLPPMHIVFGEYAGKLEPAPGERVIFMGDCATFKGQLHGRDVHVESRYVDRSKLDPLHAKDQDLLAKMARSYGQHWFHGKEDVQRLEGCPVSVAEQVLKLMHLGGLTNPYFHHQEAIPFTSCYVSWRTRTMFQRLFGTPYNRPGATHRGHSRPEQNLPIPGMPTPLEAK